MAVQKPYDSPIGVSFPTAYWIIGYVGITRRSRVIEATVEIFADDAARHAERTPVASFTASVPNDEYDAVIAGGIPALYESLKRRELSGGEDV